MNYHFNVYMFVKVSCQKLVYGSTYTAYKSMGSQSDCNLKDSEACGQISAQKVSGIMWICGWVCLLVLTGVFLAKLIS